VARSGGDDREDVAGREFTVRMVGDTGQARCCGVAIPTAALPGAKPP
jgi:hypothetical protein